MSEEVIRDVDEDLRQQQLSNLWKKYGKFLIGGIVALILFVTGNVVYKSYWEGEYETLSSDFDVAMELAEQDEIVKASQAFDALLKSGVSGYEVLGLFNQVKLHLDVDEKDKAVELYDYFYEHGTSDIAYRELAQLQAVMLLVDSADYDVIKQRVEKIAYAQSTWRFLALEMQAISALKFDKKAEAREILDKIEQDLEAADDVRARAQQLKSIIIE